jgi:hypothetical protein
LPYSTRLMCIVHADEEMKDVSQFTRVELKHARSAT